MKFCVGCGWLDRKGDGEYTCGPCKKEREAHDLTRRAAALLLDACRQRQRRGLQAKGFSPQEAVWIQRDAMHRRLERMTRR